MILKLLLVLQPLWAKQRLWTFFCKFWSQNITTLCNMPRPLKHQFSTSNFTSALLNCFDLKTLCSKTKQLRSVLIKLLVQNKCLNGRGFSSIMFHLSHSDLKCLITFGNWFWDLIVGNRSIVLKCYQQRPVFVLKNHPRPQRPQSPMKANEGRQSPKLLFFCYYHYSM